MSGEVNAPISKIDNKLLIVILNAVYVKGRAWFIKRLKRILNQLLIKLIFKNMRTGRLERLRLKEKSNIKVLDFISLLIILNGNCNFCNAMP